MFHVSLARFSSVLVVALFLSACGGGGGSGGSSGSGGTPEPPVGSFPPYIMSVSPSAAAVGSEVTVEGLQFAATPGDNHVSFNGVAASVLSVGSTTLVVKVPVGATTGNLVVSTSGGSASRGFTVLTGEGAAWQTRSSALREVCGFMDLAWTGSRLVNVGDEMSVSSDGKSWRIASSFGGGSDVAWNGKGLVAVGSAFWLNTSADGLAWAARSLPGNHNNELNGIAGSPTLWVAVGENGFLITSPDSINWTERNSGATAHLLDVTWTGSQFVVVGEAGVLLTSADGISWTPRSVPVSNRIFAVATSPTMLLASSDSGFISSADGISWALVPQTVPAHRYLTYSNGNFIASGINTIAVSADGSNWISSSSNEQPDRVVYTGSQYVGTGYERGCNGATYISDDGINWTLRNAKQDIFAMARRPADGLLVAVSFDKLHISSDGGLSWSLHAQFPLSGVLDPAFELLWSPAANAFLSAVQQGANQALYKSDDGVSWSKMGDLPCGEGLAVSDSGVLVATDSYTTGGCIATSTNHGANWTLQTAPDGKYFKRPYWVGSQFVAVGMAGELATSPDGVTWTLRESGVSVALRGVASAPGKLVVVGDSGTILTSTDGGVSWTKRTSGTTYPLRRVTWTGTGFMAIGSAGMMVRSVDGVSWSVQPTPYSSSPNAYDLLDIMRVPENGGQLVMVGDDGLIATSP